MPTACEGQSLNSHQSVNVFFYFLISRTGQPLEWLVLDINNYTFLTSWTRFADLYTNILCYKHIVEFNSFPVFIIFHTFASVCVILSCFLFAKKNNQNRFLKL
jgi:hypothetical protein